jgi:hypothetical protein
LRCVAGAALSTHAHIGFTFAAHITCCPILSPASFAARRGLRVAAEPSCLPVRPAIPPPRTLHSRPCFHTPPRHNAGTGQLAPEHFFRRPASSCSPSLSTLGPGPRLGVTTLQRDDSPEKPGPGSSPKHIPVRHAHRVNDPLVGRSPRPPLLFLAKAQRPGHNPPHRVPNACRG